MPSFQFTRHSLLKRAFSPRGDGEVPNQFADDVVAGVDYFGWEQYQDLEEFSISTANVSEVVFDPTANMRPGDLLFLAYASFSHTDAAAAHRVGLAWRSQLTTVNFFFVDTIEIPAAGANGRIAIDEPKIFPRGTIRCRSLDATGLGNNLELELLFKILPPHEYVPPR